ncbi:hypothetical protein BP5796_03740 [Coleophoma crateriformis]|uniref:Heterokaryon incompatibility domain-containing protein n=1 Tax=Coleophoma crateriformis TaxID=565419 RepID=A0A3D8SGE9_9HELO|nr:hypothetical protein BP5796_03740 [Coleophoma crateriformis]
MEHLPKFGNRATIFSIPYVCDHNYTYDKSGFDSYPGKAGLCYEQLLTRTWTSQPSLQDGAPFLQAWLYFGLLHELFQSLGIDLDLETFVAERDEGRWISTALLDELMMQLVTIKMPSHSTDYWRDNDKFSHASWNGSPRIVPYPKECLDRACQVSNDIVRHLNELGIGPGVDKLCDFELVLLSIIVLGETFEVYRSTGKWSGQKSPLKWTLPQFLERQLMLKGWCPFEIKTLYNKYPLYSYRCYMLCVLSPYDRRPLEYNHDVCTKGLCVAYRIDDVTYQSIHITGPQKPWDPNISSLQCCQALSVEDYAVITSIINDGAIPLISVLRHNATVRIECHRSQPSKSPLRWAQFLSEKLTVDRLTPGKQWVPKGRYVAISHVWSDGLGSRDNSLPACQLERLQSMVNALYVGAKCNIPFWIDTVCVPKEREGTETPRGQSLRTKAIESMYSIYEGAEKVLVLDASIMRCNASTSTLEEKVLTILCSPWGQRLWTYQEGVLARDLYFQFRDGSISYAKLNAEKINFQREKASEFFSRMLLLSKSSDQRKLKIDRFLRTDRGEEADMEDTACLYPLLQIWPILNLVGDRKRYGSGLDLQQISWDLKDRSTSKWSDESICLAILMKTDILPTIQHMNTLSEKRDRMKSLFCAFSEVNYEILVWKGPRYLEQNFRWIPTTLFTGPESIEFFFSRRLSWTPDLSAVRTYVDHRSGRLSIKQTKPALGFFYLQPEHEQHLSENNRIILDTSTQDNPEYHSISISTCKHTVPPDGQPPIYTTEYPSWQSFENKRLAVLFIRDKPRPVSIGINYTLSHSLPKFEEQKAARAILVSYTDDPIYFEKDQKKRRRMKPYGQWTVCGGEFRFEANIEYIKPISRPTEISNVVKAQAYETLEADCSLGGVFYPDRFKPPNWFIG